jgi:hypothetical protein
MLFHQVLLFCGFQAWGELQLNVIVFPSPLVDANNQIVAIFGLLER